MKVRMKSNYAGPSGVCDMGGVIDLPDNEAHALVRLQHAEFVSPPPRAAVKTETADLEGGVEDTSVRVTAKKKRRRATSD